MEVKKKASEIRATHSCIFCGKPPDSKEDLFPRWTLKAVGNRHPLYRQVGDAPPEFKEDQEVRIPCVCQNCNNTWMSGMEVTVKKFLGPMIEDLSFPLDRQNQQNLAEWATKCSMVNDAVEPHPRFFTDDECHTFKAKRKIPDGTLIFLARFTGRSLDSKGSDFTLTEPATGNLMVRGHVYTVMIGHVVLQVLSWHPEPAHQGKRVRFKPFNGPWEKLTHQAWPIREKSVKWPPPISLSTVFGPTHYEYFRMRFQNKDGHRLDIPKDKTLKGGSA
jgi:hypothetical protein